MTRCLRACASARRAGGRELMRSSSEVSSTSSLSSGEKVASTVAKSISAAAPAADPAAPPCNHAHHMLCSDRCRRNNRKDQARLQWRVLQW